MQLLSRHLAVLDALRIVGFLQLVYELCGLVLFDEADGAASPAGARESGTQRSKLLGLLDELVQLWAAALVQLPAQLELLKVLEKIWRVCASW